MHIEWEDCKQMVENNKEELIEILSKYIKNMKKDNIKTLAFLWRRKNTDGSQFIIEIEQRGKENSYSIWGYPWHEDQPNDGESIPDIDVRTGHILQVSMEDI